MKKLFLFLLSFFVLTLIVFAPHKKPDKLISKATTNKPQMCIVIDDFGSYDESGVEILKQSKIPLTCAVIPFVDNTQKHADEFEKLDHEIILHMPMQSHVTLPESWYGPVYISCGDTVQTVTQKLEKCINEFKNIKGFNIHIGSGVSRNKILMTAIYEFAKKHNLYFLDSRTIETKATEEACDNTNSIYLGRDVFLEADKNRSYSGVVFRLNEGIKIAKEKGYSIVIGHVGAEGGENTAKAIIDMEKEFENQGVEIVPLSTIFEKLKTEKVQA